MFRRWVHQRAGRISVEWTAGAIVATRLLNEYYQGKEPGWAEEAREDSMTMREGIEAYRQDITATQSAYSYSSCRGWIPFGWISHDKDVMSLASTCWVYLIDSLFNPFYLAQNK